MVKPERRKGLLGLLQTIVARIHLQDEVLCVGIMLRREKVQADQKRINAEYCFFYKIASIIRCPNKLKFIIFLLTLCIHSAIL
jgi:hypothetical protein